MLSPIHMNFCAIDIFCFIAAQKIDVSATSAESLNRSRYLWQNTNLFRDKISVLISPGAIADTDALTAKIRCQRQSASAALDVA